MSIDCGVTLAKPGAAFCRIAEASGSADWPNADRVAQARKSTPQQRDVHLVDIILISPEHEGLTACAANDGH